MAPKQHDYEREQPDEKRPLQAFHIFIQKSLIRTDNPATTKKEEFVPFEQIRDYFDKEDHLRDILSTVFQDEDPVPVDDDIVQDSYLRTFCILLSIGAAGYIRHFSEHRSLSDVRLPYDHTSRPSEFPISASQPKLWDDFCEKQWVFCALEMKYKIHDSLEPNRILPIVKREVLAEGGGAIISKIVLYRSLNKLRDRISTRSTLDYNDTFILKTYSRTEAEGYYYNEVEAFRRLRLPKEAIDPNIIQFYGSFIQNGTFNIILDFADRGTLEEYFRTVLPPTSGRDIDQFWMSLCDILTALTHIHEIYGQNTLSGSRIFQGWHEDVKPANILVKSMGIDSPYEWRFELSDFGLSYFKRTSQDGLDSDAYGTKSYSAPECYKADVFLEESNISVKQNVDIWSFGCILTEAAVWLVHGYTGLEAFRRKREEAIAQIPDMVGRDWFHDGKEVLPIVLKTINNLERDFRKSDQITGAILEEMVKNMLDVPDRRLTAKSLHRRARHILHLPGVIESPVVSSGSTSTQRLPAITTAAASTTTLSLDGSRLTQSPQTVLAVLPPADQTWVANRSLPRSEQSLTPLVYLPRPGSSSSSSIKAVKRFGLPSLDVDVAERWIQDVKAGRRRQLQDQYLLERLETRDHVFLVDDAASMKPHEAEVKRILGILAFLVKDSDPGDIELYFTCSKRKFKNKDPMKLVAAFMANCPRGLTDVGIRLGSILDNYTKSFDRSWLTKRIKPLCSLNIYVLTNGNFQRHTDLTPPLQRLTKTLNEHGKYQVGIQFISFGNESEALKLLKDLDSSLGLTSHSNIVDHERSTGNVWKMLFGSTNPWFGDQRPNQVASSTDSNTTANREVAQKSSTSLALDQEPLPEESLSKSVGNSALPILPESQADSLTSGGSQQNTITAYLDKVAQHFAESNEKRQDTEGDNVSSSYVKLENDEPESTHSGQHSEAAEHDQASLPDSILDDGRPTSAQSKRDSEQTTDDQSHSPEVAWDTNMPEELHSPIMTTEDNYFQDSETYHDNKAMQSATPPRQTNDGFTQLVELEAASMPLSWRSSFALILKGIVFPSKLPAGVRRIEWTCRCGHTSYDEFTRYPGSLKTLERELNHSKVLRRVRITTERYSLLYQLLVSIRNITNTRPFRQHPSSDSSNEGSNSSRPLESSSVDSPGSASGSNLQPSFVEFELGDISRAGVSRRRHDFPRKPIQVNNRAFLHICVDVGRNKCLEVIELGAHDPYLPNCDQQLFKRLKTIYEREWWKGHGLFLKLKAIRFVQFELWRHGRIDHLLENKLPKNTAEYEFLRKQDWKEGDPPHLPNFLVHLYHHPEEFGDDTAFLLLVPKRRSDRLIYRPLTKQNAATNIGYGIHLQQGPAEVWFQFIVVITAATLAVILSTVVDKARGDTQLSFPWTVCGFLWGVLIVLFNAWKDHFRDRYSVA